MTQTAAALTRAAIVETAVSLADERGVDGVSMRRVADRLGKGTMSLYHHVSDKDDLVAAAVEVVLGGVPRPPRDDRDWREPVRAIATWLRATLQAHPWVCELWPVTFPGPNRKRLMEEVLRTLREGGFDREMAHHGFHALDLFVVGHVQQEVAFDLGGRDPQEAMQGFLAETPAETYPYVVEHVELHAERGLDEDDFGFLLELLLDGLERHR